MRGAVLTACAFGIAWGLAGGIALAPGASADDAQRKPADPEFRLLVLDGRSVRWTIPANGLPPVITYAFLTEPAQFPGSRNCDAMLPPEAALAPSHIDPGAFRQEVRAAFAIWANAANIKFKEVSNVADAGILIGADAKARGRAFTNVALVDGAAGQAPMGTIRQSLICLNPEKPWKIGFDGDLQVYDLRFTITHEIGHAIGLDHPSPEGELMSFRYVEKGRDLQAGDIAGAAALYGHKEGLPPTLEVRANQAKSVPRPAAAGGNRFGLGAPESGGASENRAPTDARRAPDVSRR